MLGQFYLRTYGWLEICVGGRRCGRAGQDAILKFHTEAPVQILLALLLVQLPAAVLGKTAELGPSTWAPATHMEDPAGIPGSWFWPGPDLATVVIWRVEPAGGRSVSPSPSPFLQVCLPNKYNKS